MKKNLIIIALLITGFTLISMKSTLMMGIGTVVLLALAIVCMGGKNLEKTK